MGIAELLGFLEVGNALLLITHEALGETLEEITVTVVGIDGNTLFGALDGLVVIAHADA